MSRQNNLRYIYCHGGKRFLDCLLTIVALSFLFPLMGVIAGIARVNFGVPILFCQQRPGLHGQPFTLLKFRTMNDVCDKQGTLRPDAERLTRFGRFLRKTSLDELPEFINVLRGEMSLVGPRPLLMEYLPLYTSEQARRHEAKPGITGWAQINGRNAISWEEKFALDVWYVDHLSVWLDFKILRMTIRKVVQRDGISEEGEATMSQFTGSKG